jgi:hypothetical protein
LHLPVFELDRREPAENGNGNLELAASGSISSIRPVSDANAPSVIFTSSPTCIDLRHFLAAGGLDAG